MKWVATLEESSPPERHSAVQNLRLSGRKDAGLDVSVQRPDGSRDLNIQKRTCGPRHSGMGGVSAAGLAVNEPGHTH